MSTLKPKYTYKPFVLLSYCCIANHLKTHWLTTATIILLSLISSLGDALGNDLQQLWVRSLMLFQSRCGWSCHNQGLESLGPVLASGSLCVVSISYFGLHDSMVVSVQSHCLWGSCSFFRMNRLKTIKWNAWTVYDFALEIT